ncbi:MAG: hypothetical protein VYB61_06755 [Verrucomicrobiota bacterium]|nr:hypothetical protein [Verrucomicrobiota bacterium]
MQLHKHFPLAPGKDFSRYAVNIRSATRVLDINADFMIMAKGKDGTAPGVGNVEL